MTSNIVPTDLKTGTEAEQLRHYANQFATGETKRWDLAAHLLEQAADRLSELSPSRLSANDEGVTARSEEGGFVEFLNADRPVVVHDIEGPVAILRDMETREIIGYRVYEYTPPTPASGEQMEVVLPRYRATAHCDYRDETGHYSYPVMVEHPDGEYTDLAAAQKAIEQERQKYEKAVEAVNEYMIRFGQEGIRAEAAEKEVDRLLRLVEAKE